ncbi:hypothetical protein [Methylotenera sp. G11]|uniref:hypothetical protein n=1 Tax=Methylotenera sp. G11 TaxID=1506585 RepID=UPI001363876F|nr:hypothetical protein [Methylotenera sp. G11]
MTNSISLAALEAGTGMLAASVLRHAHDSIAVMHQNHDSLTKVNAGRCICRNDG